MADGATTRGGGPDEPGGPAASTTAASTPAAPASTGEVLSGHPTAPTGVAPSPGVGEPDPPAGSSGASTSGVVHVLDETIGLSGLPTGASPSAHVVDPPVPRPGVAAGGDGTGPVRDRRPASRSVRVLVATAAATLVAAAAVAVVIGALVVDGPDAVVVAAAQLAVLVPAVAVAVTLLAMVRNRLRDQIDEPVADLRQVAAAVLDGDLTARTGRAGPTDVDALAEELDAAVGSVQVHIRRLRQHAEWGAQSRMIFEALDLADDESGAHDVARQALAIVDPEQPVELLLAPHGSTELTVVATNPNQPAPGCPVDEVSGCIAIRRAQPVVFDSSESINACPKMRGRPYGPCSGACVPVSVAGRPIGVLHTVAADRHPPGERLVGQLATLATQLGNRLGALRALESSRLEAATDKLTGLPNRRLLESQLASLIERSTPFVLVLADLDNFKHLNDTYGHEIGDRALQLFAQVLRDKVRGNDVIARLGGEEFVLVYPNMSVTTSIEAVERVRDGLTQTLAVSAVPEFTCSFGITHSSVGRDSESILRVADAGLLRAKELGRDQVVYADETLAARMFGEGDDRRR